MKYVRNTTVPILVMQTLLTASMVVGCNETDLKGRTEKPEPAVLEPLTKSVQLTCESSGGSSELVIDRETDLTFTGKICFDPETTQERSTILMVLDASGSMNDNDKVIDGSCGRLKAAETLVSSIEEKSIDPDKVSLGMVAFNSRAKTIVPVTPLGRFKGYLTADLFCQQGGKTNYQEAFLEAKAVLKSIEGTKRVFFVSDGMPTISNSGEYPEVQKPVYDDGEAAAMELRQLGDLQINAIFIPPVDGFVDEEQRDGAEEYLWRITADRQRVKILDHVDQLADKDTLTFIEPEKTDITLADLSASLKEDGGDPKSVKIQSLDSGTEEGVWQYRIETLRILPPEQEGAAKELQFEVKNSASGKSHSIKLFVKKASAPSATSGDTGSQ